MPEGDLITQDYQFEFQGLLMGNGTNFDVVSLDGFDMPSVRGASINRVREDGAYLPGMELLNSRLPIMEVHVFGSDTTELDTNLALIRKAFRPIQEPAPLVFQMGTGYGFAKKRINCVPRDQSVPIGPAQSASRVEFMANLFCPDPLVYENTENSDATVVRQSVGSLGFDISFDIDFGGVSAAATVLCENTGNYRTAPIITVTGPVVDPRIVNETTAKRIDLDLTLTASEYVVIDTLNRTILKGASQLSQAASFGRLSDWWKLEPGINEISYTALSSTDPDSTSMTIAWRSAWI